jgi:serine/threonine protein kinase
MKSFFDGDASDLIMKLLRKDPKERLGSEKDALEIKKHAFFHDIDWEELEKKKIIPLFKPDLGDDLLKCFNPSADKYERKAEDVNEEEENFNGYKSIEAFTYTSDSFKDRYEHWQEPN